MQTFFMSYLPSTEAILNSNQLLNKKKILNITLFHYRKQDYDRTSRSFKKRLDTASTVKKISQEQAFKLLVKFKNIK